MTMRILSGRVEFVMMVGMLDRANAQTPRLEFGNKFARESRFAVILASNDVNSFQLGTLHPAFHAHHAINKLATGCTRPHVLGRGSNPMRWSGRAVRHVPSQVYALVQ